MKNKNLLTFFCCLLFAVTASGQDMPVGNIVQEFNCNLAEGVSMQQALSHARSNDIEVGSPAVFFRQPVIGPENFIDNYDFIVALYFPSMASLNDWQMGERSETRIEAVERRRSYFNCDGQTSRVYGVRGIPDTDGNPEPQTAMTSQFCRRLPDATLSDVYDRMVGTASSFREAGNNSLMQLSSPIMHPNQNAGPERMVRITVVAATPESLMERFDLVRNGLRAGNGLDQVYSNCNRQTLWNTFSVVRPNQS
tara:strand:+ start:1109 stop:1864 length:756 start_codon:yes stop_codon:yes gene_type:complete